MKKVLLTIVIIVGAIIIIAGIFICANKNKVANLMMEKGLGAMEQIVLQEKPKSLSADSVILIFNKAEEKIKNKEVDKNKMQKLFLSFQADYSDKHLDSLEVVNFLKELKGL